MHAELLRKAGDDFFSGLFRLMRKIYNDDNQLEDFKRSMQLNKKGNAKNASKLLSVEESKEMRIRIEVSLKQY